MGSHCLQRYGGSLELDKQHFFVPDSGPIQCLKALLARLTQLHKDQRREKNRLEKCAFIDHSNAITSSIQRQLCHLKTEIHHIETAIDTLIQNDPSLNHHRQLLCSIKGVSVKTARWLLPLLSPQRFKSARQWAAFVGLTPRHESSGSRRKPGKLSGRGNRLIRSKLYFPAISAATHDPQLNRFYRQLLRRGHNKKQALVAIMRKLVHIAFSVFKHQTPYDPLYAS